MDEKGRKGLLIKFGATLLASFAIPLAATSEIPQTINYQGYLTDSSGVSVTDTVSMTFRIYAYETGGSSLWEETQDVDVEGGLYSMILGALNPLDLVFDIPYYLGVTVGSADEMTPRQPLTSVPYALRAADADNAAHSYSVANGAITTLNIADNAVTDSKILGPISSTKIQSTGLDADTLDGNHSSAFMAASTDLWVNTAGDTMTGALDLPSDGLAVGTDQLVVSGSNVGIGTDSPTATLDVVGDLKTNVMKYFYQLASGYPGLPGWPTPRCPCDRIKSGFECGGAFYGYDDVPTACYDQHLHPTLHTPYSAQYVRIPTVTIPSTELFVESNSGNVGIGTGAPSEKLTVSGTIESTIGGVKFPDGTTQATAADRPYHRIVVAKSGAGYTSISAALAAINPSSTNGYVIDVMPGTYTENPDLKSYVHLRGAGRDVTIIESSSGDTIDINTLSDVTMSGFTLRNGVYGIDISDSEKITVRDNRMTGNAFGISCSSSDPFISNNEIANNTNNGISNSDCDSFITGNDIHRNNYRGISNSGPSGNMLIIGNKIHRNGYDGIWNNLCSPRIIGNYITNNQWSGVVQSGSSATIQGNYIRNNGRYGISIYQFSNAQVIHNKFSGNALDGGIYTDLYVDAAHSSVNRPSISFNVYNTRAGTLGTGLYNVTSRGVAAPAP